MLHYFTEEKLFQLKEEKKVRKKKRKTVGREKHKASAEAEANSCTGHRQREAVTSKQKRTREGEAVKT